VGGFGVRAVVVTRAGIGPIRLASMSEGTGSPPTEFETFYPRGHIFAAADDSGQAEAAVQALLAAGFADADLKILEPARVLQVASELEEHRGLLGHLASAFGDDHYFADQYVELAQSGHPLVAVRVPDQETASRAAAVLRAHGIHAGSYYGRWTITDL
jgi:hypothetical protein